MSSFWLRCDACNKDLKIEADREMQLAVRFKPCLVHLSIERLDSSKEKLQRCPACGWVNVFVPVERLTRPNWKDIVLK